MLRYSHFHRGATRRDRFVLLGEGFYRRFTHDRCVSEWRIHAAGIATIHAFRFFRWLSWDTDCTTEHNRDRIEFAVRPPAESSSALVHTLLRLVLRSSLEFAKRSIFTEHALRSALRAYNVRYRHWWLFPENANIETSYFKSLISCRYID